MEEIEKILNRAKEVRLTSMERDSIRRRILNYLRVSPVRGEGKVRLKAQVSGWFLARPKLMPIGLIVALFIATSGGISLAAEGALPGDLLYPVKVRVNEEVRAVLAVSLESQAGWEAERLERRLEEAETLAERGRLDAEVWMQIEERLDGHAENVRSRLEALEMGGNIESVAVLGSNLETVFTTHERILEKLAGLGEDTDLPVAVGARSASTTPESGRAHAGKGKEIESLLAKIRSRKQRAEELRVETEIKVSNLAETAARRAAEARRKSVEKKMRDVREKLDEARSRLGAEAAANIETRLAAATAALTDGNEALARGEASRAFLDFQRAFRIVQEAELLLKASERLSRDMISNGFAADDSGNEDIHDDEDDDADNDIGDDDAGVPNEVRRIPTRFGELTLLRHSDGTMELKGSLSRPNPCVNWKLDVFTVSGDPPARVEIRIQKEITAELCIQILGRPQEIRAKVRMKDRAEFLVIIDGETVFEGAWDGSSGSGGSGGDDEDSRENNNESRIETEVKASANTGGNRGGTINEGNSSINVEIINEINQ